MPHPSLAQQCTSHHPRPPPSPLCHTSILSLLEYREQEGEEAGTHPSPTSLLPEAISSAGVIAGPTASLAAVKASGSPVVTCSAPRSSCCSQLLPRPPPLSSQGDPGECTCQPGSRVDPNYVGLPVSAASLPSPPGLGDALPGWMMPGPSPSSAPLLSAFAASEAGKPTSRLAFAQRSPLLDPQGAPGLWIGTSWQPQPGPQVCVCGCACLLRCAWQLCPCLSHRPGGPFLTPRLLFLFLPWRVGLQGPPGAPGPPGPPGAPGRQVSGARCILPP